MKNLTVLFVSIFFSLNANATTCNLKKTMWSYANGTDEIKFNYDCSSKVTLKSSTITSGESIFYYTDLFTNSGFNLKTCYDEPTRYRQDVTNTWGGSYTETTHINVTNCLFTN